MVCSANRGETLLANHACKPLHVNGLLRLAANGIAEALGVIVFGGQDNGQWLGFQLIPHALV